MRKSVTEIYEEIKKETKEFAKKESLKLSIRREDYNHISITILEGKEKAMQNANESYDLFNNNKNFELNYNEYKKHIEQLIYRARVIEEFEEKAQRLENTMLTKYGFRIAQKLYKIMHKNYYDDSDIMTDYFDYAFFGELSFGNYEKDYKIKEKKVA